MRLSTSVNLYSVRRSGNLAELMVQGVGMCKRAGYDAVDFSLGPMQDETRDYQERWIDRVNEEMEKHDIHATQGHSYLLNTRLLDDEGVKQYRSLLRHGIVLASRLGIPNLVVHPLCFVKSRDISEAESLALNREFFRSLSEDLEKHHVVAALENLPRTEYDRAEKLLELYEAIDSPSCFGFCWDTGHANLVDEVRDRQPENIMMLGKKLTCTHIQDNHGEKDEHLMPMMGNIVWPPIIQALKASGYEGDFTYESAQPVKYLPDDDILRGKFMSYTVELGRYLLRTY